MTRNTPPILVILAIAACNERLTAPEVISSIVQWDTASRQLSSEGLAMTWAPVNSFANLPGAAELAVTLDGQVVIYRALVFENNMENSRYERAGCPPNAHVTLVLWRVAQREEGLDVIVAHIGAEPGPMDGRVLATRVDYTCGLTRTAGAGAYINWRRSAALGTNRPAAGGRYQVRRVGGDSPCDFITRPEELGWYGATCRRQAYNVELEAELGRDQTGRGAARGAAHIRVSGRRVPGAVFTIHCAATDWGRGVCG